MSAQKAEITASTRASELGEDQEFILTDSKNTSHVLHAHAATHQERGLWTAETLPLNVGKKHKLYLGLSLTAGAIRKNSQVSKGNASADDSAEGAAVQGFLEMPLIPQPNGNPNPQHAEPNTEQAPRGHTEDADGWWASGHTVTLPVVSQWEITKEDMTPPIWEKEP